MARMLQLELIVQLLLTAEFAVGCIRDSLFKHIGKRIAGNDAKIEDYPYNAQVMSWKGEKWVYECSAIIIDDRFALTASQCVTRDGKREDFRIISGSTKREHGTWHKISKEVTHPGCDWGPVDCIAVVQVEPAFPYNTRSVGLAFEDEQASFGTKGVVSGWGKSTYGGSLSNNLKTAQVTIESGSACSKDWGTFRKEKLLCISNDESQECSGDSGSPVVSKGWLVGVVSKSGCDYATSIALNVVQYQKWIKEKTDDMRREYERETAFHGDSAY